MTITRISPALLSAQRRGTQRRQAVKRFDWADTLAFQVTAAGLPEPQREQLLVLPRKFRTDLSWLEIKTFVEVDGGEWSHGQHGRGQGMQDDCVKWNLLTLAGWRGFRFTGSQVKSGYALTTIEQALKP